MKAAILYAAKSTADKNASIPAQLADGRRMAEADGWTIVDEFHDENKSAFTGNRGEGLANAQQLAEELTERDDVEQVGIFIQHSDRLARGDAIQAAHLLEYVLWAVKTDVYFFSDQDPVTFENRDFIYAALMGQRNHEDSKRKSKSVRDGIGRRVRERGLHTGGGNRRYGYQWSEIPKRPVSVVPFEAGVIENRMYRPTLEGVSGLQIMRELEADRIKTVRGGRWHGASISQILRNPFYKGVIVYDGEEYPGIHPAIIDLELWQEVADFLAARKTPGRRRGQGRAPAGKHLFWKGMLKCVCGESMVPRTTKRTLKSGKLAVYEHYECYGHHRDPSACSVSAIRREVIDTPAYRYFERVGIDLEATRAQLASAQDNRVTETRALLAEAERDRQQARASLERVERDYLAGEIEAADWNRFKGNLREDLEAAESQAEQLSTRVEQVEQIDAGRDLEESVLQKLTAIRSAIVGEVSDAAGVTAASAAIRRLFEGFYLREPELGLSVPSELAWIDRFVVEPRTREGVVPGVLPLVDAKGAVVENQNVGVVV